MYESKSVIFLLLFFLLAHTITAAGTSKAIKFRLCDGHRVINNAVVVVDNDKITSVTANGRVPAGAEVIEADINVVLRNVRWVMKGGAVVVDETKPATRSN